VTDDVPPLVGPPLVVRASRGMAWARLGVVLVMLLAALVFGGTIPPGGRPLVAIFLLVCLISSLWTFTDLGPRLIVRDDGLLWRDWPSRRLGFTAWSRFSEARIIEHRRRLDLFWLRLELIDGEDRRYVQVKLEGLDVDEDDLKRAINLRAPHLFPDLDAAA
jgi:hypothetical protein